MTLRPTYFLYMFELPNGLNPAGAMSKLRESVRNYFETRGLEYGIGALGGDFRCYGHVQRSGGVTTEEDRKALATWVLEQNLRGIAKFSDLIQLEADDQIQLDQPLSWVFPLESI